jgi:hypothetical protein
MDANLEPGKVLAELAPAAVRTRECGRCGSIDTDAWLLDPASPRCGCCRVPRPVGKTSCRQCQAGPENCRALIYAGCSACRPDARTNVACDLQAGELVPVAGPPAGAVKSALDSRDPVFHIVEEPGGVEIMADVEVPTEEYYDAFAADLKQRHPKAAAFAIEHVTCLECFLDTSIIAGFSFGSDKAIIAAQSGDHLGHRISRTGATCSPERTQAVRDFAPLKDVAQLRQFLGRANWIRWYLLPSYATAVKMLSGFMTPGAKFLPEGLGATSTDGCEVAKAIKLMAQHAIETAVLDEVGAIDGSRPLEFADGWRRFHASSAGVAGLGH